MAKARIVVLEPHDVLFIPPLWLHHVTALDELTLSVNVFSHADEQAVFDERSSPSRCRSRRAGWKPTRRAGGRS